MTIQNVAIKIFETSLNVIFSGNYLVDFNFNLEVLIRKIIILMRYYSF